MNLDFIKKWEGCKLTAYKPIPTDPWTIGYGATGHDITEGLIWNQPKADSDLERRLENIQECISSNIGFTRYDHLTEGQVMALSSLAYNIGINALLKSTLMFKLRHDFPKEEIADEFLKWVKSAGKVIPGLVNRREAERKLFLGA